MFSNTLFGSRNKTTAQPLMRRDEPLAAVALLALGLHTYRGSPASVSLCLSFMCLSVPVSLFLFQVSLSLCLSVLLSCLSLSLSLSLSRSLSLSLCHCLSVAPSCVPRSLSLCLSFICLSFVNPIHPPFSAISSALLGSGASELPEAGGGAPGGLPSPPGMGGGRRHQCPGGLAPSQPALLALPRQRLPAHGAQLGRPAHGPVPVHPGLR